MSKTTFEENVKDDEAAAEESPQEILDENGLPDIPDTVLDEMIMEALPEAEEYFYQLHRNLHKEWCPFLPYRY